MTLDSAAIIALELVDFPQSHCLISDWLGVGLSDNLRNETLRDRRETEERRVEQWRRSQAADVKSAQAAA